MTVMFSHLISSFCFLSAIIGVQVEQAAAQTHASAPAPPSTLTRPDSIQDSGFYNYWANMSAQGRAGGVLLGKLAMEGEPLPWEPMLVNVDCKGSIVNSTQADLKGQFVITFTNTQGVERTPQDAQRQMETKYEGLHGARLARWISFQRCDDNGPEPARRAQPRDHYAFLGRPRRRH